MKGISGAANTCDIANTMHRNSGTQHAAVLKDSFGNICRCDRTIINLKVASLSCHHTKNTAVC